MKTTTTRLSFALLTALTAVGATLAAAPAAQAQVVGSVNVRIGTPPPAPRYEAAPPPRRGYAWAPGYWAWDGHRHVWVGGHWEQVRRGYARYEPAHWQQGPRGGWHFVPGHWMR
ncbi:YXWGXW repeat-containing protein [Herbaspirillum sp. LeCh32-8]|uniref:YXWGXW repeat-containing protein n=1 Tax=Herbaspirillum sp. LeCh32-8 TaxID=2821356 RepID=UPI001AEB7D9E|nr:YXWGXW repeat-containing protein [Herbaspirillum sp. LeCh32-8]MBP0598937.1 YXWGXW repeat-containing protein [Herbaspirillum sp. LeCh32-8]